MSIAEKVWTVVREKRRGLIMAIGEKEIEINSLSGRVQTFEALKAFKDLLTMKAKLKTLDEIIEEADAAGDSPS